MNDTTSQVRQDSVTERDGDGCGPATGSGDGPSIPAAESHRGTSSTEAESSPTPHLPAPSDNSVSQFLPFVWMNMPVSFLNPVDTIILTLSQRDVSSVYVAVPLSSGGPAEMVVAQARILEFVLVRHVMNAFRPPTVNVRLRSGEAVEFSPLSRNLNLMVWVHIMNLLVRERETVLADWARERSERDQEVILKELEDDLLSEYWDEN